MQNPTDETAYYKNWVDFVSRLTYPVSIIDANLNVITANTAMLRLYSKSSYPDHDKFYKFFHNADSPAKGCPLCRLIKNGTEGQLEIYDNTLKKTLNINISPIIMDGIPVAAVQSILKSYDKVEEPEDHSDLIEIYSHSLSELKAQATNAQKGRDAFLNMLEDINESYGDLEELFMQLILVMVNALDAKSPWTKGHSERVAKYAEQIAREMLIDPDDIKNIRLAGLLHDIGKIGTYDYLLDKPGKLTAEEFDIVKEHPAQGANILKEIKQLREIIPFIKYHHEKLDGNGYPDKISGSMIPLGARILHVADSFDSMTSDRPYRPAPGIEYALSELEKHKGVQFDQSVVMAFMNVFERNNQLK